MRSISARCAENFSRTAAGIPSMGKSRTTTRPEVGVVQSNRTIRGPMIGWPRNAPSTACWKGEPAALGAEGPGALLFAPSPLRVAIMSSTCRRASSSLASPRAVFSWASAAVSFPWR